MAYVVQQSLDQALAGLAFRNSSMRLFVARYATLEYLVREVQCLTLFVTHYQVSHLVQTQMSNLPSQDEQRCGMSGMF